MLLAIDEIPPQGLDVEVSMEPCVLGDNSIAVEERITGTLHLSKHGSLVLIKGAVKGRVKLTCSRCLKEFSHEIQKNMFIEMRPESSISGGEEKELSQDDLDVEFFQGSSIDSDHLLVEQICLNLPMKPLCSSECRGICSSCGEDRNLGCSCAEEDFDPRWEALKDLKNPKT